MWLVCGYYTGKVYKEYAERLKKSLIQFNLLFDIQQVEEQGNWYKNTQYKPTFLKQMLKKHFPNNIVYIDADAVVCKPLDYFDRLDKTSKIDIAVHILDHSKRRRGSHVPELLSGTIYLKNTDIINQLLDEWILRCSKGGTLWDQHALACVLKNPKYRYTELPEEYCTIFDYMSDVKNPVIRHFQASREERRKITTTTIPQQKTKFNVVPRMIIQNSQIRIKRVNLNK